jgi:steroid delta-isomerase-like uncharacterized protein
MATRLTKQMKAPYDAFNAHDLEKFLALHTDDVEIEDVPGGSSAKGIDKGRTYINNYFEGFKDVKMELISCIAGGNRQCEEFIVSGTHTGTFSGIPATGKKINIRGVLIRQLRRGKTCRVTNYYDLAALMRQLGISAPPAPK